MQQAPYMFSAARNVKRDRRICIIAAIVEMHIIIRYSLESFFFLNQYLVGSVNIFGVKGNEKKCLVFLLFLGLFLQIPDNGTS